MINLSLDELKLVAESRSISEYENKSKKDLIKVLGKPKPKIRIKKKKLEEIRKDFNELRHNLSTSEIKKSRKRHTKLKKVCSLKRFMVILIMLIMIILIIIMIIMMLLMMNTEKLEALKDCLKSLIEIITNQ